MWVVGGEEGRVGRASFRPLRMVREMRGVGAEEGGVRRARVRPLRMVKERRGVELTVRREWCGG
jgi:hypothetical protein